MITFLTGGTGGAKLIEGFAAEIDPAELTIVCNTADDCVFHGLHVSPDVDTIIYTLAGIADAAKGWGIERETFTVLEQLQRLGAETWFSLGDRDLATHILRTQWLREGLKLAEITDLIRARLGVTARILPMSDDRVESRLLTPAGNMSFQEYFVRDRWAPEVTAVRFSGAAESSPAPGVIEAIESAQAVVVCPSNPVTSIGPILAVPGIRPALLRTDAKIAAVSPIIGSEAISGPAHRLMTAAGFDPSCAGVARAYAEFIDAFVFADEDRDREGELNALGIKAVAADIRMPDRDGKRRLAREVLALLGKSC
jgi:LPPG:FO 2-phospho-L-lactate transferase